MSFPKPGKKPKQQKRDKKELDLAKGQACVNCGLNDGTIVSCHYSGIMQHEYGKSAGGKVDDEKTAFLCHSCHAEADQYKKYRGVMTWEQKLEHHEWWMEMIRRTDKVRERLRNQVKVK